MILWTDLPIWLYGPEFETRAYVGSPILDHASGTILGIDCVVQFSATRFMTAATYR